MMRFFFVLFGAFVLILFFSKFLVYYRISRIRNKIKKNPLIGIKKEGDNYYYKEKGYTVNYNIIESSAGIKIVEWVFIKRRLTNFEEKVLKLKKALDNFLIYQKWLVLFRPSIVGILIISLLIFTFGIKQRSFKHAQYFKWVVSQITGISPGSIEYAGEGRFNISGQRNPKGRESEPLIISFNPFRWLFFSDNATVSLWSKKSNKYIDYAVTVNDKGDVWLGQDIHGRASVDEIIWDTPQRAGNNTKASGQRITVENGKLKISDE